jgi:hypothetical protein
VDPADSLYIAHTKSRPHQGGLESKSCETSTSAASGQTASSSAAAAAIAETRSAGSCTSETSNESVEYAETMIADSGKFVCCCIEPYTNCNDIVEMTALNPIVR